MSENADLYPVVLDFLRAQGLDATVKAMAKEAKISATAAASGPTLIEVHREACLERRPAHGAQTRLTQMVHPALGEIGLVD